jgi:lipopolysaccharide/colanic/teichoic acid biosynthesis glycosyltransferase
LLISSTALVIFAFDIQDGKWEYFIESIISYSVTSFIMFLVLYARTLPYPTDEISNVFLRAFELENPESVITGEQHKINNKLVIDALPETQLKEKFKLQYFRDFPDVYRFLNRSLELNSFDETKTLVIRSSDSYNVEVLNKNSIQLLVNLHEINDLFRINDYFRIVNSKLIDGGVYSGCLIPIKNRYKTFQKKYPFLIASLFYFFDFIWRRVFPKIPLLRKIYFSLTKGKDRAISLTEALGRLVYCGFKIIDLTEIDEFVFFAANKIKEPSTDTNPSYSPIFKMRRIGKDGKQIFVYKIRTMHPYSEYLQEFVYERNKLTSGGKFKNDFRISSWGRILRKLWIDELPMIINLLKGELKLIGVRPVSNHYLSLYSIEFRQRRMKYKPGLFPPFYADMPKTIEEIEQSEKKYFDAYDKSHFKTDVKYFFRIIYNIIFKNKRSS